MRQKTKSRKHYFPFLSSADIIAVSTVELNTASYIFSNGKLSTFGAKRLWEFSNIHLVSCGNNTLHSSGLAALYFPIMFAVLDQLPVRRHQSQGQLE